MEFICTNMGQKLRDKYFIVKWLSDTLIGPDHWITWDKCTYSIHAFSYL